MAPRKEPTFVKELDCDLTEEEFGQRARHYAKLDEQLDVLEVQKKAAVDGFKEQIEEVEAERGKLRRIVLSRKELREVQCQWSADWASRSMLLRRLDTQQVVDSRTMTPDEHQEALDFEKDTRAAEYERNGGVQDAEIVTPEAKRLSAGDKPAKGKRGRKADAEPRHDA
jgi:hypothetical protein